jgi:hypothetical protein
VRDITKRKWFTNKNGGKAGLVILGIGIAIPTITFVKLFIQFLLEGAVCASACVTRGWEGVLAAWAAIPFLFIVGVTFAISAAFASRGDSLAGVLVRHNDLTKDQRQIRRCHSQPALWF